MTVPGEPFRPSHIGIDLGTTFCCQAYLDENGDPQVIPSAEGESTTPSVIWFDGTRAYVGKKANEKKVGAPQHIYEFVKRDMGKPESAAGERGVDTAPYAIGGFAYGAAGMSALILRKLKRDALREFKRKKFVAPNLEEKDFRPRVVITVPAYFGDHQRTATKLAGHCAGLEVIGIINEPTAAALSYGVVNPEPQRAMVFDLGGGTFDVTILQLQGGSAEVLASGGDSALGGKDWDELIQSYLYEVYRRRTGQELDTDFVTGFDIQQKALQAKFELTEQPETAVTLTGPGGEIDVVLQRAASASASNPYAMDVSDDAFYFDQRATELLSRCRRLCEEALSRIAVATPGGAERPMTWSDLSEIVLAGGSCRMPMIPAMLEQAARRPVRRQIPGFSYDTAIGIGAALFGQQLVGAKGIEIIDVVSHSIGILVDRDHRHVVEHLLHRDTPLPTETSRSYTAPANAALEVYEGESERPDECVRLGMMELGNPQGRVKVTLRLGRDGILLARTRHLGSGAEKVLEVKHEAFASGAQWRTELCKRVQAVLLLS